MNMTTALRLVWWGVMLTVAASCAKLSPAGFWTTYRTELIEDQYSNQGPWGGIRWVHWVAPTPETFTSAGAVEFATSQGWACQRPGPYSAEQMRMWQYSGKSVFPLHFGPADRPPNRRSVAKLARHIDGDSWIIQCTSGWIRVAPGSGESSPAFGYIQIDRSGTRMAVYHLWGEV